MTTGKLNARLDAIEKVNPCRYCYRSTKLLYHKDYDYQKKKKIKDDKIHELEVELQFRNEEIILLKKMVRDLQNSILNQSQSYCPDFSVHHTRTQPMEFKLQEYGNR